jgi:TetR/AcrR family transcriptional regulator, cholesterol catabolism regulator
MASLSTKPHSPAIARRAPPPANAALTRGRGRPKKTEAQVDEGNRRQALIGAAAKLFRRHGFDGTSTRDIALASGMQSGSPFYHFENKQALLFAVMQSGMSRAIERQAEALRALQDQSPGHVADAKAIFHCLVSKHFEVLLGEGNDFIPVMLYESRSINAEQREVIKDLQRQYEAAWLPVLEALHKRGEISGPTQLARLLIFGALNWSVQWYRVEAGVSLAELTDTAVGLFLHSQRETKDQPKRTALP